MKLSEAIKELESLSPSEKAIEIVLQALENYKRRYELAIKQNVKDYKNSRKKIKELIKNKNHKILESVHPSPLSANRGFFGSKPFSQTNQFLISHGQTPINW